ncbi:MAG: hypothetical protein ABSB26_04535 [Nitrososphaerales archaeon]|jgi:hypothetical protein
MRSGRSALGVIAGVLLGLSLVLAGSGLGSYGGPYAAFTGNPVLTTSTSTSVQYVKTNASGVWYIPSEVGTASSNSTNDQGKWILMSGPNAVQTYVASHLDNIARQPITLTGFALLPVFAALLVGFVLYRVSRARNEREEPPEAA